MNSRNLFFRQKSGRTALGSASKELVAAYLGVATAAIDHDEMSYHYINPMKEILVNLFPYLGDTSDPINGYKLTALAWSGLGSTRAFKDQSPAWRAAQIAWLNDFKNGTTGTPCP